MINIVAFTMPLRMEPELVCICPSTNSCGGFPGGSVAKNPAANAEDTGLIPGRRRVPGEANGYPLWYSCLGNPMDREETGGLQSMGLQKGWT